MTDKKPIADNPRLKALLSLFDIEHYQKISNQMSTPEFDQIIDFIENLGHLDHDEFAQAIAWHYQGDEKREHNATIAVLLNAANDIVYPKKKE